MHFVYILRCRDGSYYVGSTHNVETRVRVHHSGQGPAFTARRIPVELVYQESFATLGEAVRRERQLKGWSRAKKEALIAGDKTAALHELAASKSSSDVSGSRSPNRSNACRNEESSYEIAAFLALFHDRPLSLTASSLRSLLSAFSSWLCTRALPVIISLFSRSQALPGNSGAPGLSRLCLAESHSCPHRQGPLGAWDPGRAGRRLIGSRIAKELLSRGVGF